MTKRTCILYLIAIFIFCFPTNCFAEVFEGNTKSHANIIVDTENNSIEFIYTDSEDDVINGVFNDIPGNAWYQVIINTVQLH